MSGIWKAWLSAGYETSDSREFHTFYKKFSQVVDSIVVFDSLNIPIGIQAASGTYYPV